MRRRLGAAASLAAGLLLVHGDTLAGDAGAGREAADPERRAKVVAVVGGGALSRSIALGDLEDRVAVMPEFQRATFGAGADAIRRRVLDEILVRDDLLSLGAQAAKVEAQPAVARALDRAISGATVRAIRDAAGPADIPMADVAAYYEKNRVRYDAPARYQVWRILCKTRDDAGSVLAAAKADPSTKTFAQLARDHSEDKATALRSGNLGFLTAEGESSEPGLRVDSAIVRAAQGVRDGDLVPEPVVEGDFFAVVWRRGTLAAQKRTALEVAAPIREILWREGAKARVDELLARLRAANVHDLHEDLLDNVELSATPVDASRAP
jgi:peptidyl-prolyl cis-trans isomerase C